MNQHARPESAPIPFIDVAAQRRRLGRAIDDAIERVLDHCQFILGPEVGRLEADLSQFCGARHAITCSSGTDALLLALMARGVGAGDAVICPAFTFTASAEVVAVAGATPVFADVDETSFNLDPESCARAIGTARGLGLKTKAIIAVDLFGQGADHRAIAAVADAENLFALDDAAQAFGATCQNQRIGTLALATATSFFPAKPLGCYGDGGAVFTDDDELAAAIRSLRVHGEGAHRYESARIGINGRFDTIQAAILIEKLKIFPEEIIARDRIAQRYSRALADLAVVPRLGEGMTSVWAQYTIRLPAGKRAAFTAALKARGVPTAIYYPIPLNRQEAYRHFPVADGGVPVSERLAEEVISLPMHAYLDAPTQDRIIEAVRQALAG
jgi:dTDP-4-amino-4,6-dideoxygalactose transaminase